MVESQVHVATTPLHEYFMQALTTCRSLNDPPTQWRASSPSLFRLQCMLVAHQPQLKAVPVKGEGTGCEVPCASCCTFTSWDSALTKCT